MKTKFKTVDDYIDSLPRGIRSRFIQVRRAIKSSAPNSTESLKWGMPAFSHQRILVAYAAFKNHIGFYPTPSAVKAFAKDLAKYKTAKGSIQFPHDKKLPLTLVKKITRFRVKESLKKDSRWKKQSV